MSDPNNYTIGWISAIEIEYAAAQEFLDDEHDGPKWVHHNDENNYTLGRIGKHNVVIAVLPRGDNGVAAAAMAAKDMMHTFPNVRVCLMVGIGGGAPSRRHDIRLGDVVVSVPTFSEKGGNQGGVIQYDYGRTIQERCFQGARYLNQPPRALLTAVTGLSMKYKRRGNEIDTTINNILQKDQRLQKEYGRPDPGSDILYSSDPVQTLDANENLALKLIERPERSEKEDNPAIHHGLIASAYGFMEDAQIRDILAEELDVLCFEMEAAGLMNSFPCLVIRGICDYSDRHWFKEWRGYAAMAAAAYANALLHMLPVSDVEKMQTIRDLLRPDIVERAKSFIAPLWGDKKEEAVSVSVMADPEETQTTDRSGDQSHQMLPNQTEKPPPAKTDVTKGQTETKHVYIAVMGVTGAGKSSLISLCTSKNVKIGHNLESCTADVEDVEFMFNDHVCVHLIDTPGFDDTSRSDVEVLQNIAVWLSDSFEQGTKLSGIIYLHRIIDVRMAGSALRNLSMFKKLCGEEAYSSVVLATSMWGLVDEAIGVQRERELIETKKFWGYMHEKGSRIFRLDRTRESCLEIIKYIISLGSTTLLELQDEIVNKGRQIEDTEAGVQLNEDIIRERKKHQAELLDLKKQMQEMAEMAEQDAELQRVLKEEYEELRESIRRNDEEQAKLKQDLKDVHERKEREFLELKKQMEADRKKYEDDMRNQKEAREREFLELKKQVEADRKKYENDMRNQKEAFNALNQSGVASDFVGTFRMPQQFNQEIITKALSDAVTLFVSAGHEWNNQHALAIANFRQTLLSNGFTRLIYPGDGQWVFGPDTAAEKIRRFVVGENLARGSTSAVVDFIDFSRMLGSRNTLAVQLVNAVNQSGVESDFVGTFRMPQQFNQEIITKALSNAVTSFVSAGNTWNNQHALAIANFRQTLLSNGFTRLVYPGDKQWVLGPDTAAEKIRRFVVGENLAPGSTSAVVDFIDFSRMLGSRDKLAVRLVSDSPFSSC